MTLCHCGAVLSTEREQRLGYCTSCEGRILASRDDDLGTGSLLAMLFAVGIFGAVTWLVGLGPRIRRAWCHHWEARAAHHLIDMVRSGKAGL